MANYQINCVNKEPRSDPHHGITHLGSFGNRWTRQQVVDMINSGRDTFHTMVGGKMAYLAVRTSANGTHYVQTHADGYYSNNLLALPECGG